VINWIHVAKADSSGIRDPQTEGVLLRLGCRAHRDRARRAGWDGGAVVAVISVTLEEVDQEFVYEIQIHTRLERVLPLNK
jgi:hypothetical protein